MFVSFLSSVIHIRFYRRLNLQTDSMFHFFHANINGEKLIFNIDFMAYLISYLYVIIIPACQPILGVKKSQNDCTDCFCLPMPMPPLLLLFSSFVIVVAVVVALLLAATELLSCSCCFDCGKQRGEKNFFWFSCASDRSQSPSTPPPPRPSQAAAKRTTPVCVCRCVFMCVSVRSIFKFRT